MKPLYVLAHSIDSVPELPYGDFTEKDKEILNDIKDYLCKGDHTRVQLLEKYVEAHMKNAANAVAFEAAGPSQ